MLLSDQPTVVYTGPGPWLKEGRISSSCTLASGAGSEYQALYSGPLLIAEWPGKEFHAGETKWAIGWLVTGADIGGVEISPLELCVELFELVWSEGGYSSDGLRR